MTDSATLPDLRRLEINGGYVQGDPPRKLLLPPVTNGYANAQIDDYGHAGRRRHFPWRPGLTLQLAARFSHPAPGLRGTAGFGFWNAPFADPSISGLALPQATWFFFASDPSDLPFSIERPGRGWFAGTVDASSPGAVALAPLAPFALLANQFEPLRDRLWPAIRQRLHISHAPLHVNLTSWHTYELRWQKNGCLFLVDGNTVLDTPHSPQGPLGFVCWIDNQYLVLTPRGRLSWGTLPTIETQWLEIRDLSIRPE